MDAGVYIVSPETAVASALNGYISDASGIDFAKAQLPDYFLVDDSAILMPDGDPSKPIIKGPNIKAVPVGMPLAPIDAKVMITCGDNITTDHITPGGASVLPFRSNIEKIAANTFAQMDPDFVERCKTHGGGIIVAGDNYGQGSSREHAALAPLYLGIRAVIAKTYARIHRQNLINAGIVPLCFADAADYAAVERLDELEITGIETMTPGSRHTVLNKTRNTEFMVRHDLTAEQIKTLKAGGLLNQIKASQRT